MATLETVLRVFVASPGDVADDRKCLARVVEELNLTWSRTFLVRLELVRWETHTYPDIGEDAQDVINRQIGEFDIFLGIMWMRFGTPTGRAGSGTEEEFDRALDRYKADPRAVRLMFYFKNAPRPKLSPPGQPSAVHRFQEKVTRSGLFWHPYRKIGEFEQLVRRHLSQQVQEWGKTWGVGIRELPHPRAARAATEEIRSNAVPASVEGAARSITAIVFDEMAGQKDLVQRRDHDPEVIHRSFLEAQLALDSAPTGDVWGRLAAEQAATLVAIALAGRLVPNEATQSCVTHVCERIVGLRGLHITWGARGSQVLYDLLTKASDRHDDDVLLWIKRHTRKRR